MADHRGPSSRSSRTPLGDATSRVNNAASTKPLKPSQPQPRVTQPDPLRAHPTNNTSRQHADSNGTTKRDSSQAPSSANPRTSAIVQDSQGPTKRDSQVSTTSATPSNRRHKTHIGPWKLGKTLGNGSAARVRLVRHNVTEETAAVKILSRNCDEMMQPGSIAALDKWDRTREEYKTQKRIPFAIEREVAIMKLIDHPNIVKLYDIWENRSEIYLVIEYVEQGDFYGHLARRGRLSEAETMFFFRQILSALEYVHSFNICHRDLKPENILLTSDYQIKVTDFGMSAIHQSPYHMLKTSCGSPHYAAPELIGVGCYRGDKVDLWSLGVILYACLCNYLPFNDDHVPRLLGKIQKGMYDLPSYLSPEAKNLITRMLEVDPDTRISAPEIWQHTLVSRHDYLDDLNNVDRTHDFRQGARYDPVPVDELDMQTLRQLKSIWHTYSEKELATKLVNEGENDFKLFYRLLCDYREKRLENYGTAMTSSASDYHHLQHATWAKKYSTLEFPAQHGRSMSRFTVISNIPTDENGEVLETSSTDGGATIKSYDPYKASRVMDDVVASRAKIVIHRNGTTSTRTSKAPSVRSGSVKTSSTHSRRAKSGRHTKAPTTSRDTRRSLNSIKSGEEVSYKRSASRRKRGVDFLHAHKPTVDKGDAARRSTSVGVRDVSYDRKSSTLLDSSADASAPKSSERNRSNTQSAKDVSQGKDDGASWNEELRHFSSIIAKDCDDAFNSTLLSLESSLSENLFEPSISDIRANSTPTGTPTPAVQGATEPNVVIHGWDSRPLPDEPNDSDMHEYVTAKKRAERVRGSSLESAGQAEKAASQFHKPSRSEGSYGKSEKERRIVSAPIYSQYSTQWGKDTIPLPSINEVSREDDSYEDYNKARVVSAPAESSAARYTREDEVEGLEHLAQHRETIRFVDSPSNRRGKTTAPTTAKVRKESSLNTEVNVQAGLGLSLRQQYMAGGKKDSVSEEIAVLNRESSAATVKKKSSWFKRGSKDKDGLFNRSSSGNTDELSHMETNSSTGLASLPAKKKSFPFAFWRGSKEQRQYRLSIAESDREDSPSPEPTGTFGRSSQQLQGKKSNDKALGRVIDPQQSWLARFFRVKPATRYLCFSLPKYRVRQEIAFILREWRSYGIRDIVVNKERNIVFARVAKQNELYLKEATFAAEVMTVIEHGKRNKLSIVRFIQERGAASTFNKVIDTMNDVFNSRGLLVVDKYKAKMMIRTLNA